MIPIDEPILMNVTYIHEKSKSVYRAVLIVDDYKVIKSRWAKQRLIVYQRLSSSLFYGKSETLFRESFTRTFKP